MFSISLVELVYLVPSYYWYIKHVITNKATVLIDLPMTKCLTIMSFFRLNFEILVRKNPSVTIIV
jgi:hypothetical protein